MKKIIGLFTLFLMFSCAGNRFDVPGNPQQNITIQRFDKAFYEQSHQIDSAFLNLYADQIMEVGKPGSRMFRQFENIYRKDKEISRIYKDCQNTFQDISPIEEQLTWSFHRLHYFFPNIQIPKVYMHIAGFGESIVSAPGILSASIDKYLGQDYALYKNLFRPYQSQRMYPDKLASDYVIGWVRSEFTEEVLMDNDRLLDYMIYEGKILYLVKVLMPEETMENLTGFSSNQLNWCLNNELQMWETITKQQHLYSTDVKVIAKYIREFSHTPFFPQESPGRAATWIGYRIIEAYMEKHQKATIQDLMYKTKSQDILKGSGYLI